MTVLTGTKIKDTYPSLIKTEDNLPVDGTLKKLTDGVGNELPLEASTAGIKFTGEVDFDGATVTGIKSGELDVSLTDFSTSIFYYGGLVDETEWQINKWDDGVKTIANQENNPTFTNLGDAWDNKETLIYE